MLKHTAALLLLILLWVSPLMAANYYVSTATNSPAGSDMNAGTIGAPFLTFAKCASVIIHGETCYFRAGSYNAHIIYNSGDGHHDGTSFSDALTFKNYNGEVVTFTAHGVGASGDTMIGFGGSYPTHESYYWILDGFILDGELDQCLCSAIGGLVADYVRIQNMTMINFREVMIEGTGINGWEILNNDIHGYGFPGTALTLHNVYVKGSNVLIDGNNIYNSTGFGIQFFLTNGCTTADGTDPITECAYNSVIRNNKIHDNYTNHLGGGNGSGGGMLVGTCQGCQVYNNLIYNNFADGLDIDYRCGNPNVGTFAACAAYNNTVYGNEGGIRVGAHAYYDMQGTILKNNVVYNSGTAISVNQDVPNGGVVSPIITNNFLTDPSFTNAGSAIFTLQAGSGAINYGLNLTSLGIAALNVDFAGIARPSSSTWDAGAYQYGTTSPVIASVTPSSGMQNASNLALTLVGTSTNWVNGTSVCSLTGTGLTIVSTVVSSATAAVCTITIAANATLSTRDVTMATNSEVATAHSAFTITAQPGTRASGVFMRIAR